MSGVLEEIEDLIRQKIENERWTHKQLSVYLKHTFWDARGFSVRSLER